MVEFVLDKASDNGENFDDNEFNADAVLAAEVLSSLNDVQKEESSLVLHACGCLSRAAALQKRVCAFRHSHFDDSQDYDPEHAADEGDDVLFKIRTEAGEARFDATALTDISPDSGLAYKVTEYSLNVATKAIAVAPDVALVKHGRLASEVDAKHTNIKG